MALYRTISINFWTDVKVDDEFTPEDKYFFLYLLTNPHTNICGCYEISIKQMGRETGYNEETIKRLLKRMETQHKVLQYEYETQEIFIYNWSKYNWSASGKLKTAVEKTAKQIKTKRFQDYILKLLNKELNILDIQNIATATVTDTVTDVSIGYPYPMDTVSPKKSKRFVKPTLEDIKAYCQGRNNSVNAERFFDYYESNGWKVGKNSMKDWKAAIRTWEKNGFSNDEKPKAIPRDENDPMCEGFI